PVVQRGSVITINGSGFSHTPSDNQVSFKAADGGVIRIAPLSSSVSQLSVQVPNTAASGAIQAYRLDLNIGSSGFPLPIASTPVPLTLTSITPFYQAPVGSTVTLSGLGFDPVAANNTVRFTTASGV